jgi:hypothetical protein
MKMPSALSMHEAARARAAVGAAVVAWLALTAAPVAAQAPGTGLQSFFSITPVYQGKAGLEGGGEYGAYSTILRAGLSTGFGSGHRAGLTFNYDYADNSFDEPTAFLGGRAPWGDIKRYGVAAPLIFNLGDGWGLSAVPSVDWIRENGADEGESLNWGAIVSVNRVFADRNRIGFGLGAFRRIDDTGVFPLILVDWKLSERWRLVNPLPAGPTGPAGLELDYRCDSDWNLGVGAAWRSTRFRLSSTGPVPNGIGEERGAPVFLRATRGLAPGATLNLYAGMIFAGQLRVEDPSGFTAERAVDLDPAPLLGATISARF